VIRLNLIPDPLIECDNQKVYFPSEDSFLMIDYIKDRINETHFDGIKLSEIENVLDMGTGTGITAIYLQLLKSQYRFFNPRIIASDITEEAILCAKKNEALNKIDEEITFLKSDLFENFPHGLKSSFNIITFNPPYLPSSEHMKILEDKRNVDYSWNGGNKGFELSLQFLKEALNFLNLEKDHYIYIISSSRSDSVELNNGILNLDYICEVVEKRHYFFEDIILNRLKHIRS
jgi:HemK-related putative methylase